MVQPLEIEVKLNASPPMLEALRVHPLLAGTEHTETLVTTYFDTIDEKLRSGGAALRMRDTGLVREQTLKINSHHAATVRRHEWTVPLTSELPIPSDFPEAARSALLTLLGCQTLKRVGTTRIERTVRRLRFGHSAIEIAFDVGIIQAGGREEDVCELEMELVEGHLGDVIALALQLPLGPQLRWSVSTKAARCYSLAFDVHPEAVHPRTVELSSAMDVAQGFQAIAWNCLEQLLANYPLVSASGDLEGVHQARVAIRRLRAAGNVFAKITHDQVQSVLRAEMKAAAAGLGPARDLYVLYEGVASAAGNEGDRFNELLFHLAAQRDSAVASAQALMTTEAFQRLLFEFAAWLEEGEWLKRKEKSGGNQPLAPFSKRVLSRRRRKLLRIEGRLADLPDESRHRMRIEVKKLRYATGFFVSLFPDQSTGKPQRSFAKKLGQLQDSLGQLNDMAVAAERRTKLFANLEPIVAAKHAAQLEGLLEKQGPSRRKLLKAAERTLDELKAAPAWWKRT